MGSAGTALDPLHAGLPCDRCRGDHPAPPRRRLPRLYDRTLGYQASRGSPFSVWGQAPSLHWLQTLSKVFALGLAALFFFVPEAALDRSGRCARGSSADRRPGDREPLVLPVRGLVRPAGPLGHLRPAPGARNPQSGAPRHGIRQPVERSAAIFRHRAKDRPARRAGQFGHDGSDETGCGVRRRRVLAGVRKPASRRLRPRPHRDGESPCLLPADRERRRGPTACASTTPSATGSALPRQPLPPGAGVPDIRSHLLAQDVIYVGGGSLISLSASGARTGSTRCFGRPTRRA